MIWIFCHSLVCSHFAERISCCWPCKGKVKVPILVIERRGRSWSRTLGSQPAGDSMHSHGPGGRLSPPPTRPTVTHMHSHKPGFRLPLLSARPTVTFPAVGHHHPQAITKLYCLVTECEKLVQSFYAVAPGRDSNPRPLDRKSDTLPQHHGATL